jgi:hypothetical protein
VARACFRELSGLHRDDEAGRFTPRQCPLTHAFDPNTMRLLPFSFPSARGLDHLQQHKHHIKTNAHDSHSFLSHLALLAIAPAHCIAPWSARRCQVPMIGPHVSACFLWAGSTHGQAAPARFAPCQASRRRGAPGQPPYLGTGRSRRLYPLA